MGTGPVSSLCHMQSHTGPGAQKGSRLIYSSAIAMLKFHVQIHFVLGPNHVASPGGRCPV